MLAVPIHLPYEQGGPVCHPHPIDFIRSKMKPEGDVKEARLEGAENLQVGFPHLRTARAVEN